MKLDFEDFKSTLDQLVGKFNKDETSVFEQYAAMCAIKQECKGIINMVDGHSELLRLTMLRKIKEEEERKPK